MASGVVPCGMAAPTPAPAAARTGPILFATCGACVLVMATTAAGTTTLPAIAREMEPSQSQILALAATAIGMALMAVLGQAGEYAVLVPAFVVLGIGSGFGSTPPTEAILESLSPAQQGVASAVNDAARELGAAVGIAVLGSAFNAGYRADVGKALAGIPEPLAEAVRSSPAAAAPAAAVGQSE